MKTGAGEDPFADEDDGGTGEENGSDASPDRRDRSSATRSSNGRPAGGSSGSRSRGGDRRRGPGDETEPGDGDDRVEPSDLPFIARRNARGDNVKAERDTRRLFELRPDVAQREEQFMAALERELGREVPKTDAREAALAVVYDRPELVAEKLEEWGVNYFEG